MRFNYFLSVVFFLVLFSCNKEQINEPDDEILYFNSFENASDTAGWKGYCFVDLVDEVPENGGKKSVRISCGCIGPHTYFDIPSCEKDCYLIVTCQGKGEGVGGGVALENKTGSIRFGIDGEIHKWQFFQTSDTLFCPAGEKLTMYLIGGGEAGGTIYLDMLQVEKVEK